jgi:hypothetical protein
VDAANEYQRAQADCRHQRHARLRMSRFQYL